MKKAIIALTGLVCACGVGAEDEARKAVARNLRDPASAQFRDVAVYDKYVCGEINGKNGMGAYAGFLRFWFNRETKEFQIDPEGGEGDDIDKTSQRIFEGTIETFCKAS